ncbi:MAG: ribose-5-phosphate isomerase RpiA [Dongiaceae bacterium]
MTGENERDALKRAAAEAAVAMIEDGMVVGIGSGTTAAQAITVLGEKVAAGLRVTGIPTSEKSAAQARGLGIPLADFAAHQQIDLAFDGADEVEPGPLNLIKGLGGALLREKIVASASRRLVIMVDGGKLVPRLGSHAPVPVEVVPFGWQVTARRLGALGAEVTPRRDAAGGLAPTDGGNITLDCRFSPIADPAALACRLREIVGVIESGLFIGLTSEVIVAEPGGIRRLRPA